MFFCVSNGPFASTDITLTVLHIFCHDTYIIISDLIEKEVTWEPLEEKDETEENGDTDGHENNDAASSDTDTEDEETGEDRDADCGESVETGNEDDLNSHQVGHD